MLSRFPVSKIGCTGDGVGKFGAGDGLVVPPVIEFGLSGLWGIVYARASFSFAVSLNCRFLSFCFLFWAMSSAKHSTTPQTTRRTITIITPTDIELSSDVSAVGLLVRRGTGEGLAVGLLVDGAAEGLGEGMRTIFVAVGSPRIAAEITPQS